MQSRRISEFCDEFLACLMLFRRSPGAASIGYEEFRAQINGYLASMDRDAALAGIPPADYEAAKYALVGLVDEIVSGSDWFYRDEWERKPLQIERYGTLEAGDLFFEKLDALRPDQQGALEIFYLCLLLGFEGRLRGQPEKLFHYKSKVYALVAPLRADPARKLTPEAYGNRPEATGAVLGALPSWWVVAAGAGGLFLVVYLLYALAISWSAGSAAERLQALLAG